MRVPYAPQLLTFLISSSIASATMAEELVTSSVDANILGFSDALNLAKQHDPQLKFAFFNYQAEQEQDEIALSQLLPNIRLSSSYVKQDVDDTFTRNKTKINGDPVDGVDENPARYAGTQDYYTFQLNVQQSLINVAAWQAYSSSKDAVKQSQFSYTRAEQELIYRLAQAYLEALLAAQQVYIYQEKLESLQLKVDQTQRMNELGVGDRLNVLRATSSRDVARSDLLEAQSHLDDAKTLLENLTGSNIQIPQDWIRNSHKVLPNLMTDDKQSWIAKVQDNALVQAELSNVRSKESEANSSNSQHLPTLDLSLSYVDRNSEDLYKYSENYTASLDLTIPIYSGGRTSAQARQAEAGYNAAQARYEQTLSEKTQAVKLAFSQINSFYNRLLAIDESRKSSQAYLEAAERQADLSLGSQVAVLEARTDLYDVRLEFAKTLTDYLLADLNLLLETGRLNDETLDRFDQLFTAKTL